MMSPKRCRWSTPSRQWEASRAVHASDRIVPMPTGPMTVRREELRARGITPKIARRRQAHGSGLGIYRYVAEQRLGCMVSSG